MESDDGGRTQTRRVPRAASWLGALGLMPFVALSLACAVIDGPGKNEALFALAAYGAVILSFLGGVHWGLALAGSGAAQNGRELFRRLTYSVLPALIGWVALLLPTPANLLTLSVAFLILLAYDFVASRANRAPAWYPTLRWPLTLIVTAALLFAVVA